MSAHHRALALVLLVSLLTTACGAAEPMATSAPPTATQTPVPPTATVVAPTSPPVPTNALAPPTDTPTLPATAMIPIDTPLPSKATTTPSPTAESPVSGLIAFYSERDGNAEIYVMNADGSGQTRLTDNAADDMSPDWSPDGKRLVFVSDRDDPNPVKCFPHCNYEIYTMNADGSGQTRLTDTSAAEHHPAWSPAGEEPARIAFVSERDGNQEIYVIAVPDGTDADGGNSLRLTDNPAEDMRPSWSPDGSQIVFNSMRDGNWELYVMNADGSAQQRLTDSEAWEFFPTWSPDGEEIAFFACDPQCRPNRQDIYAMNPDGTDVRRLTDSPSTVDEDPAWSPDGDKIVFQSDRDGNFEIYTMNADGSDQQRLTNHRGGDYWPSWGPALTPTPGTVLLFQKSTQTFPSVPTWKIGLGDLDGDDDLDAIFANGQANHSQIWLNDGSGTFVDSGQQLMQYGHGIDVGDLDGDGDLDVFITSHSASKPSKVYLNDGHAEFQDSGQDYGNVGYSVDLADMDGDGDLDAMTENLEATNIYLNDGAAHFTLSEITLPQASVAGDLDSDGDVDLFSKEESAGYTVMLGDGAGSLSRHWTYEDTTAMLLGDMALGDVDNDGDLDAVITNGHFQSISYPALAFFNDGTGQFVDSGQQLSAVRNAGVSLGDLDGDGDLDLVLTDYMEPCQIWLNDGSGQFIDSGFRFGDDQFYRHAHLGDLDGDGDLDIVLATFGIHRGPNEIWFNSQN
jgi:Tol biopolymer transport system component